MKSELLDHALSEARARRRLPAPEARRMLRERAGVPQQAIADTLDVTREAVAQWETGRRTPRGANLTGYLAILERLARESLSS
jgi:DNA-binding transcriptional regulator YiaG